MVYVYIKLCMYNYKCGSANFKLQNHHCLQYLNSFLWSQRPQECIITVQPRQLIVVSSLAFAKGKRGDRACILLLSTAVHENTAASILACHQLQTAPHSPQFAVREDELGGR